MSQDSDLYNALRRILSPAVVPAPPTGPSRARPQQAPIVPRSAAGGAAAAVLALKLQPSPTPTTPVNPASEVRLEPTPPQLQNASPVSPAVLFRRRRTLAVPLAAFAPSSGPNPSPNPSPPLCPDTPPPSTPPSDHTAEPPLSEEPQEDTPDAPLVSFGLESDDGSLQLSPRTATTTPDLASHQPHFPPLPDAPALSRHSLLSLGSDHRSVSQSGFMTPTPPRDLATEAPTAQAESTTDAPSTMRHRRLTGATLSTLDPSTSGGPGPLPMPHPQPLVFGLARRGAAKARAEEEDLGVDELLGLSLSSMSVSQASDNSLFRNNTRRASSQAHSASRVVRASQRPGDGAMMSHRLASGSGLAEFGKSCVRPQEVLFSSRVLLGTDEDGNSTVNDYTLWQELGSGSAGVVYLGLTPEGEPRAVKAVPRRNLRCGLTDDGLLREVAIMKKLRHPHVVTLYECIDDPEADCVYLVMRHVPNGPVATAHANGNCTHTSIAAATRYARQLASALEYMHRKGVVHGDIKPENILVDATVGQPSRVFFADFGISRIVASSAVAAAVAGSRAATPQSQPTEPSGSPGSSFLRRQQVQLSGPSSSFSSVRSSPRNLAPAVHQGTPAFLAPELFAGSTPSRASDVWALGATLFCLLFGRLPFVAASLPQLVHVVVCGDLHFPPSLPAARQWVPLLTSMLSKDAASRPTARQVAAAIAALHATGEGHADGAEDDELSEAIAVTAPEIEAAVTRRPSAIGVSKQLAEEITARSVPPSVAASFRVPRPHLTATLSD